MPTRPLRPEGLRAACVSVAGVLGMLLAAPAARAQLTAHTLVGKAVSDDSQYPDIDNAIARFRDRDLSGCRSILERARSSNAKLPPTGVMMAVLWLSVQQVAPAIAELEDAAVTAPDDPEAYLLLGDLAFQNRRTTDAGVLFEKARLLNESFTENAKRKRDFDIRCHAGLAAVAETRKQWDLAAEELRGWLARDPDAASGHQRLAVVLFHLGKPQDALTEFREAKKLDDKAPHPELAMARLYDEAKNHETAKKLIDLAARTSPQDPAVLLAAAQWYLSQNDLATATRHADDALKAEPKSLEGKVVRGAIARVARDYAVAKDYFNQAHVQSPGNFPASNSLALVLVESDEADDRRRALEMAEATAAMQRDGSPFHVGAMTTLAWVYYKTGRREDAEKILSQISQNNQLSTDGAYYVAKMLADRGDKERARRILEEVLASDVLFATRRDATDLLASLKKDR